LLIISGYFIVSEGIKTRPKVGGIKPMESLNIGITDGIMECWNNGMLRKWDNK
jgi:hypothetical protein